MANTLAMVEAVNLFCGDHDPKDSNHIELMQFKLPELGYKTNEHAPGGAIASINMVMPDLAPLEFTFKLKGMNPVRLAQFGLGGVSPRTYTAYGVIRDKQDNSLKDVVAVIHGVLAKISSSEFSRGDGIDHDYMVTQVDYYSLTIDQKPIYELDVWNSAFSVGGVSQTDQINRLLRIPGKA